MKYIVRAHIRAMYVPVKSFRLQQWPTYLNSFFSGVANSLGFGTRRYGADLFYHSKIGWFHFYVWLREQRHSCYVFGWRDRDQEDTSPFAMR